MFGTIARMKLKPGSFEKLQALGRQMGERNAKGFQFTASYKSSADPDEVWLVIGFEDEASYRANADDPETDRMSQTMGELMAAPPEWHDGEIVALRIAKGVKGTG